jgi:hypothetical protein
LSDAPKAGLSNAFIFIAAFFALGAYILIFFGQRLSNDPAEWGQFGDFVGGILNPLVAFSAFRWLVASVQIQKEELSETRLALRDTQKAQQDQADTSLLAARIQTLNIELSRVVSQLQHYRERQLRLIDVSNRSVTPTAYIDEDGMVSNIGNIRQDINSNIRYLESEADRIVSAIKGLSSKFKDTAHLGKPTTDSGPLVINQTTTLN